MDRCPTWWRGRVTKSGRKSRKCASQRQRTVTAGARPTLRVAEAIHAALGLLARAAAHVACITMIHRLTHARATITRAVARAVLRAGVRLTPIASVALVAETPPQAGQQRASARAVRALGSNARAGPVHLRAVGTGEAFDARAPAGEADPSAAAVPTHRTLRAPSWRRALGTAIEAAVATRPSERANTRAVDALPMPGTVGSLLAAKEWQERHAFLDWPRQCTGKRRAECR